MGMYTGLRFKGTLKKELIGDLKTIVQTGKWEISKIEEIKNFSKLRRSSFIPCGALCCMPVEWDEGLENKLEKNGQWTFKCSLKNYEDEIESFFEILPIILEKSDIIELFYEEWEFSEMYKLVNGKIELVENQYKRYI